ncbi:hypothetical protein [uncultured Sphingomonas sp.]|nr:hypothetical protein [uncultured Sphingomonas sp.]
MALSGIAIRKAKTRDEAYKLYVKPDFPEAKTDWPFLWFENE